MTKILFINQTTVIHAHKTILKMGHSLSRTFCEFSKESGCTL